MFKKLASMASAVSAFALIAFTQVTVSSGGVVALESTDTTALMDGVGNAMSSLVNLFISVWPIMLTITVVLGFIALIRRLGKLKR